VKERYRIEASRLKRFGVTADSQTDRNYIDLLYRSQFRPKKFALMFVLVQQLSINNIFSPRILKILFNPRIL